MYKLYLWSAIFSSFVHVCVCVFFVFFSVLRVFLLRVVFVLTLFIGGVSVLCRSSFLHACLHLFPAVFLSVPSFSL